MLIRESLVFQFHVWRLVGDRVISTLHASLRFDMSSEEQVRGSARVLTQK